MPATATHVMPDAGKVAKMIASLVGRAVTCKPGKAVVPAPKAPVVVATFVEAGGKLAAAWISDLALAAGAGASLVMLPAVVAEECVKAGKLNENVTENFHEVLNVCAGLFNAASAPRVLLGTVTTTEKLPDAVAAMAKAPVARLDLEVAIPGYTGGRLTLLCV